MSATRPTPETDAKYTAVEGLSCLAVIGEMTAFARQLECERDDARERAESKHGLWMSELKRVTALEKQLATMRVAAASACELLQGVEERLDGNHGMVVQAALAKLQPHLRL